MKDVFNTKQLTRDTINGKVSGVCSGVAKYFEIDSWIVRIAAIAAFIFMPIPVAVAYLLGVVLLPTR